MVLAGCNGNNLYARRGELISAPPGTISIYQLAGRLDMTVVQSFREWAELRDRANAVLIYADPGGRAYVNGQPVGDSGGVVAVSGMLFVPQTLEPQVRLAMRAWPRGLFERPASPRTYVPQVRLGPVVLDPGHGGRDPGATSILGHQEKDIVLAVSLAAAKMLERRGVDVSLTRSDDVFLSLTDRPALADRRGAKLFVSIHADAAPNRSAKGFTLYVSRSASGRSRSAAATIAKRLGRAGPQGAGRRGRGIREANFRVLVYSTCPAVLVELGYLSNVSEAARLAEPHYQQRLAEAICDGVIDFLQRRR